jgi:hypothetical protein
MGSKRQKHKSLQILLNMYLFVENFALIIFVTQIPDFIKK